MKRRALSESQLESDLMSDNHREVISGIAAAIPWARQEGRMVGDFAA